MRIAAYRVTRMGPKTKQMSEASLLGHVGLPNN